MGIFASKSADPDKLGKSVIDSISDAQLDDFKEAFSQYDKDGSGVINAKEMKELLASVGQHPSDEELEQMISAADADGTGGTPARRCRSFTDPFAPFDPCRPLPISHNPNPVLRTIRHDR